MPYPNFQTKWVSVLPSIGVECPSCHGGIVEDNTFTAKDGKKYDSVICENCHLKWILSKFSPKEAGQMGGTERIIDELDQGEMLIKQGEQIIRGLGIIRGDIKGLSDKIEVIEGLLRGADVVYPKNK